MEKFTVKIQKETWEYEICAYPYSGDAEKYIKATRFHKGKFVQEMSVDLSCVHPEFFEVQAERIHQFPLILSCCGAGVCFFIGISFFLSLLMGKNMTAASALIIIPLAAGWYCWDYFLRKRKINTVSEFLFTDKWNKEKEWFSIPYEQGKRAEALQLAQTISSYCNQALILPQQQAVMRHQFANGLAELRDTELVLFNRDGVKCGNCDYAWCVPGTIHHTETHRVRNFFCILFAAIFWLGPLLLIISIAKNTQDREMILGSGLIYIIPFLLGFAFLSRLRESQNYYYAGNRFEEAEWGIFLRVGKNPGSEKEFIAELNRRLRHYGS